MNDFLFALRQLGKSPVFTLLAVLTLGVAVGLNSAIFSLIHALFLQALPFSRLWTRCLHLRRSKGTRVKATSLLRPEILALSRWTKRLLEHRRGYWRELYLYRDG